ncbi:hypothetical protein FGO68_gene1378 [Halteria grandinella]|uniref:Uncharacterized protein n=1 Tax=Halteria grandinella TaxID=5974 RepID=A0A8J8NE08_HALGN|nr:hypothetical protein FGO68_gene1378 [Halteria grandinella]
MSIHSLVLLCATFLIQVTRGIQFFPSFNTGRSTQRSPYQDSPFFYNTCEELGDFTLDLGDKDVCISCRGIFPGCRRCIPQTENSTSAFMCDSCDAGMYLMPVEYLSQDQEQGTKRYRVCVPDCNAANSAMVNNPEKLRCEYLGQYCHFGNYTHGCLRSH